MLLLRQGCGKEIRPWEADKLVELPRGFAGIEGLDTDSLASPY